MKTEHDWVMTPATSAEGGYLYCRVCGVVRNEKNMHTACKGAPPIKTREATMQCPECSTLWEDTAKKCRHCGCALGAKPMMGTYTEHGVALGGPQESDAINPAHYKAGGMEVIDIIEAFGLGFHRANACKYLLRAGRKDPGKTAEDLRKCIWYLERELSRMDKT